MRMSRNSYGVGVTRCQPVRWFPMSEPPQQPAAHDATGLDLARTVARSIGSQSRRRRRNDAARSPGSPQASGAHPDDRDPKLLSEAMDRLVESQGWATEINV